jgi:hypothetical protein
LPLAVVAVNRRLVIGDAQMADEAVVESTESSVTTPEASESIQAGYDRIANPEKVHETPEVKPVVEEKAPTAETPPPEPTYTGDQIKEVMAQVANLDKRLRDEGGRYGGLKKSLEDIQQRMTVSTTANPVDVDELLKDIKDEFGDDNALYLSLKNAFSKVMAGKAADPETISKMVAEKIDQARQADFAEAETLLTEAHPTWRDDVRSPECAAWMETLPEKERNRFKRSNDPDYVSDKLDAFQTWKAAQVKKPEPKPEAKPEAKPPETKPSARLLKAVMPTNGTKAKPAAEDDTKASIRAGYERVAGARIR